MDRHRALAAQLAAFGTAWVLLVGWLTDLLGTLICFLRHWAGPVVGECKFALLWSGILLTPGLTVLALAALLVAASRRNR